MDETTKMLELLGYMTVSQLSRAIHVPQPTVWRWVYGKNEMPLLAAARIANALTVPLQSVVDAHAADMGQGITLETMMADNPDMIVVDRDVGRLVDIAEEIKNIAKILS